jgi:hypothetical protein
MATKIQFRRDYSNNWENSNPTLSQGEPGLDLCRGVIKVGNGSDSWNCLPFQGTGERPNGSVAIGEYAGNCCQGQHSVAIGSESGEYSQNWVAVAVGRSAGNCNQSTGATAVGHLAGQCSQGYHATAIGRKAGRYYQGEYAVAIGAEAGQCGQCCTAVAVGYRAAQCCQDGGSVAIGEYAGQYSQGYHSVAIGSYAGNGCYGGQSWLAIAIGRSAGANSQNNSTVAIGHLAAQWCQSSDGIAIGRGAGRYCQQYRAIAIGHNAGYGCCDSQGQYSIAIGTNAGYCYQQQYSIAINASCSSLNPDNSGFYVNPIRVFNSCGADDSGTVLNSVFYDPNTNEVIRAPQMPQNYIEANGNYTLQLTDAGKHIYKVGTGDVLIDINGNVAFPIGTTITLVTGSDNSTRIQPVDSGTTTLILSKFGADASINVPVDTYVTILKIENEKWMIQT